MLFNSDAFLLVFLPLTIAAFLAARRFVGVRAMTLVLLVASFIFYGEAGWRYLLLLLVSLVLNFACGGWLLRPAPVATRRRILVAGVAGNLAVLFWFKYAGFAATELHAATGFDLALGAIALPIGISFYTFQKIAYLVDVWRRETVDRDLLRYALFVGFFPQLIAGPIVHHREFTTQLPGLRGRPLGSDLAVGLTILTIGLAKKVVLADSFVHTASPVFDAAAAGTPPGLFGAWLGVLAYGLQIYFDFSGYSDMAIGLARIFGIQLPINFASPYQARSIVDFWRRWHITLSRFLRDYLYIPLGGNRRGPRRRLVNIAATMLLGGIWHGAGWNFAVWGALHAAMLCGAHLWRDARLPALHAVLARVLTLLGVMLAWVPFRAADFSTSVSIWAGMVGAHGTRGAAPSVLDILAAPLALRAPGIDWSLALAFAVVGVGLGIALFAPNTQTLMRRWQPGLPSPGYESGIVETTPERAEWRPSWRIAALVGAGFGICLMVLDGASEFIYFQF